MQNFYYQNKIEHIQDIHAEGSFSYSNFFFWGMHVFIFHNEPWL